MNRDLLPPCRGISKRFKPPVEDKTTQAPISTRKDIEPEAITMQ